MAVLSVLGNMVFLLLVGDLLVGGAHGVGVLAVLLLDLVESWRESVSLWIIGVRAVERAYPCQRSPRSRCWWFVEGQT